MPCRTSKRNALRENKFHILRECDAYWFAVRLPRVIRKSEVTSNHVLEQSGRGILGQGQYHFSQNHRDVAESVVSLTYVRQTAVVQQYLLQDEGGYGFA